MENGEKEKQMTSKISGGIKTIGVILVFMIFIAFIILGFWIAIILFEPTKSDEYKSDDEQMREWMENKGCE